MIIDTIQLKTYVIKYWGEGINMQISSIDNSSNNAQKLNTSDEKSKNSGSVEQQIEELKKEINRLQQKRANPVAVGECHDESGSRPDIAKASAKDMAAKIRAEIDQKIQQLQLKIQQLESQNAGNSENTKQQNIKNENEIQNINTEVLKSMGEAGHFVDERV